MNRQVDTKRKVITDCIVTMVGGTFAMSFPKYRNLRTGVKWFGDVQLIGSMGNSNGSSILVDKSYGIVQAGPNVEGGVPYIRPADMTDEAGVASESEMLGRPKKLRIHILEA